MNLCGLTKIDFVKYYGKQFVENQNRNFYIAHEKKATTMNHKTKLLLKVFLDLANTDFFSRYGLLILWYLDQFSPGSMSVNVSAESRTGRSEYVNAGQLSDSSSIREEPYKLLSICLMAFVLNIPILSIFQFL